MTEKTTPTDDANSSSADALEPAIPSNLRVPRTQPLRVPAGFTPQHASYSARFRPEVIGVVIAYYGVQYAPTGKASAQQTLENIKSTMEAMDGPSFSDVGWYLDHQGFSNSIVAAYWQDQVAHRRWETRLGADWWYRSLDLSGHVGVFREIYQPSICDTETTFSHRHPEGFARVAEAMSGKTDTHEYWGSARDRIPRAQTDALVARGRPFTDSIGPNDDSLGRLVVVVPHDNLCLLRSGQDWSETEGSERDFYLENVKPYLDAGMDELSNRGVRLGCYFNRYLRLGDPVGPSERTYSLSAWRSLEALETWVRADTHLAIWGAGIKHYKRVGETARLRLYHESAVLRAEDQSFAYFNCHRRTGMLGALTDGAWPS